MDATHEWFGDEGRGNSGICTCLRHAGDEWKDVLERIHCVDGGAQCGVEQKKRVPLGKF